MLAYNEIIASSGVLRHAVYLHLLLISYHYLKLSHYNLLIQYQQREQSEAHIKNISTINLTSIFH